MASHDEDEGVDCGETRHLRRIETIISNDPSYMRMNSVINLLGSGISRIPRLEWERVGPNDLSATACLVRTYRSLQSAVHLLLFGYYGEVRVLLRTAYECAALSRMLAKNPKLADKWMRKDHWFPDREVRNWWASVQDEDSASSDDAGAIYASAYRMMSSWAHPTFMSCAPLVISTDTQSNGPEYQLKVSFNETGFLYLIKEIAGAALFGCFALRNAAVDERAMDPAWRQALYSLAREITEHEMPQLERNWEEENSQYELLRGRIQTAEQLEVRLRNDPLSWQNLHRPGGDADTSEPS